MRVEIDIPVGKAAQAVYEQPVSLGGIISGVVRGTVKASVATGKGVAAFYRGGISPKDVVDAVKRKAQDEKLLDAWAENARQV